MIHLSSFLDLLKEEVVSIFAGVLCKLLIGQNGYQDKLMRFPWKGYHGYDIARRLDAFLYVSAQQLPEFQCVRHAAINDSGIFKNAEAFSTLVATVEEYEEDLHTLRYLCSCNNCTMFSKLELHGNGLRDSVHSFRTVTRNDVLGKDSVHHIRISLDSFMA